MDRLDSIARHFDGATYTLSGGIISMGLLDVLDMLGQYERGFMVLIALVTCFTSIIFRVWALKIIKERGDRRILESERDGKG